MAQDFERNIHRQLTTSAATLRTADSDDALVGINIANTATSQIEVDVFIASGGNDYYLVKGAPIPAGSALQLLDGGAKVVMQSGDVLKAQSNTATSADVWVSVVDAIST